MTFRPHFGTAGIRGVINREITPDLALRLGQTLGDHLGRKGSVLLGHDTRFGAATLADAAAAGLTSSGIDVHDAGLVPTGAFATCLLHGNHDAGYLITGSHMPPDRTGLALLQADATYFPDRRSTRIEELLVNPNRRATPPPPEEVARRIGAPEAAEHFLSDLLARSDAALWRRRTLRILVDPVNGAACATLPEMLRRLGCDVVLHNAVPGPVPARPSEPRARVLGPTAEHLVAESCDLGVATDVDADRILFLTRDGTVLSEDLVGACLAVRALAGVSRPSCIVPINSSGIIEVACGRAGADLDYCPPGQPAIQDACLTNHAHFSYEESGKYFFFREVPWADAHLTCLRVVESLLREEKDLSDWIAEFPAFFQVKHTVPCPDDAKEAVMAHVPELGTRRMTEGRTLDVTIDGWKRCFKDNSWVLVRASGTEPLIRVYADAPGEERARSLVRDGTALLAQAMRSEGLEPEAST